MTADMRRLDGRHARLRDGEIVVVACARDEALRLPCFLRHYRALGVGRFFFVDDRSTDGTTELLLTESDVHVFQSTRGFRESHGGSDWRNALLDRFACGHWALNVDVDELFIYPECERLDLKGLTAFLDREGAQAMNAILLDMYGRGPIRDTRYRAGDSLLDACPFFDGDSYRDPWPQFQDLPARGGPRARLFQFEGGRPGPLLVKVPLVRWRRGLAYDGSAHWLSGVERSRVTGALLHFKLLADFPHRAREGAERGEYWNGATEYQSYSRTLDANPDLTAFYGGSVEFRNSRQIVDLGLMRTIPSCVEFAR